MFRRAAEQLDVFDASCDGGAGVAGAFVADLSPTGNDGIYNSSTGRSLPTMISALTEEADDLYGINNYYLHEDLGADIIDHTPVQAVSPNSPSYNYPDATLDAKIALRDWLADEYACSNPAGGIRNTHVQWRRPLQFFGLIALGGSSVCASSVERRMAHELYNLEHVRCLRGSGN